MPKLSAGLLLFRRVDDGVEVLVAHPGGPIWARRDSGAWSLPKGAIDGGESALEAAGGVQKRAAELLHIKPTTLNEMIKRYDIRPRRKKAGAPDGDDRLEPATSDVE